MSLHKPVLQRVLFSVSVQDGSGVAASSAAHAVYTRLFCPIFDPFLTYQQS